MNPLYRSIAACPACHGALIFVEAAACCRCGQCGRIYALADGVPFLRLAADGTPAPASLPPASDPSLRSRLLVLTEPPDFAYKTATSRNRIPQFVEHLGPDAVILNLGSGRTSYGQRVVNLDIGAFVNVDVVAVGERLPVQDASLDGLITQGVLEHVPDLAATLAEIDRVLRPGGLVYHEIPFIQGFHGSPSDFRRFTLTGIRELAPGYDVLDTGVICGPSSAMLWISSEWLALLFSFGNETLLKAGRRGFAWLLSPIKLADAWLENHPHADLIASAFYIVARKL
jgi:SAM-dependent methyltransferase